MAAALRYALYAWLIASAIALVIQLIRRRRFDRTATSVDSAAVEAAPINAAPIKEEAAAETEPAISEPSLAVAKTDTAGRGSHSAALDVEPQPGKVDESAVATPDDHRQPAPTPSLAALLEGVHLPASLAPIVADGIEPNDNYLCLHTTTAGPEDVGLGLADELERLGYAVLGISENEAVAQRGDDVVSMRIDARPAETSVAGIRRYPEANDGDVVVEVWSGAGPRPSA